MKHTPGPWITSIYNDIVYVEGRGSIASFENIVCKIPRYFSNCEANARLIAAAPRMLEALKEIMARTKYPDRYMLARKSIPEIIEEVISKIEDD